MPPPGFSGTGTAVVSIILKFNSAVSFGTLPTVAFTPNVLTAGNNFYYATSDLGPAMAGFFGYSGTGTITGSSIGFSGGGNGASFPAGESFVISLVYF